ncbi:uncharacterized protein DNG_04977 [Cephalotrichum gorgonifer]|uniref:Ketoreductase domain-containing protein n=1 Tax=Cephalotrichum gorgonifer TaxID=2041049 RepID=A0AAE8MZ37_9PEZI|nr:uncharacterized protein DNG_04977 [Cephalotrichum gorgonifer]
MEVTFGAAGDFIAIGLLIKDIIRALDDSRGSSNEYSQLKVSLELLDKVLLQVHEICSEPDNGGAGATAFLGNDLRIGGLSHRVVSQIRQSVEAFAKRNGKFETALGPTTSTSSSRPGRALRDVARKVQWVFEERDIEKFRGEIQMYTALLEILLHTLNVYDQNPACGPQVFTYLTNTVTNKIHTLMSRHAIRETRKELNTGLASLRDATHTMVRAQNTSLAELFGRMCRTLLGKLSTVSRMVGEVKQCSKQVLTVGLRVYSELRALQVLVKRLARPISEDHFILEDALGRSFVIHLRTIPSWAAFDFILKEMFRGQKGARRIAKYRYKLQERQSHRLIDRSRIWDASFKPNETIFMSLMCRDAENSSVSQLSTCPACKTISTGSADEEIVCRKCGMTYQRVVEVDEEERSVPPPPPLFSRRTPPKFGISSFKIHGPELPPKNKKRHKRTDDGEVESCACGRSKRAKTTAADSEDSSSDDEDVSGLARITVMTKLKKLRPGTGPFRAMGILTFGDLARAAAGTIGSAEDALQHGKLGSDVRLATSTSLRKRHFVALPMCNSTLPDRLLLPQNRPLRGTTAVVTGAGRGIGRAIAMAFARAGCNVACVSRTWSEVDDVARLIKAAGLAEAKAIVCDVTDVAAISALASEIRLWIDRPVHVLVNNAGVARLDAVEHQSDLGAWNRVLATNLSGPVALTYQFLPGMISSGSGAIISIGSRNAIYTIPFMSAYSVSKTGLLRFHENLGQELRGKGVNNFYVVPGNVETSILDSSEAIDAESYRCSSGVRRMAALISEAQKSPPEVVATTCVRLVVDENAGFLSGRYIDCDTNVDALFEDIQKAGESECVRRGLYKLRMDTLPV